MNLLLVLSFGGSLKKWRDVGLLSRELELYLRYLQEGYVGRLFIFSWDPADHAVLDSLTLAADLRGRIMLLCPERPLGGAASQLAYSVRGAFSSRAALKDVTWVKTNQISGSWTAILVKLFQRKKLLARCGYIWSSNLRARGEWLMYPAALVLEAVLFNLADRISVTTPHAKARVDRLCRKGKAFVAPTYVDTELFVPPPGARPTAPRLAFVGRCEPPKNVLALVRACALAEVGLHVFGGGSLAAEMVRLARELNVPLVMEGRVPNEQLAKRLQDFTFYILPSLYEGLPKSLVEAMSAGLVCIGTNVPGITDLIEDGVTGYIASGVDEQSIAAAIRRALAAADNASIARNARAFVLDRHSLDTYMRREMGEMRGADSRRAGRLPAGQEAA